MAQLSCLSEAAEAPRGTTSVGRNDHGGLPTVACHVSWDTVSMLRCVGQLLPRLLLLMTPQWLLPVLLLLPSLSGPPALLPLAVLLPLRW